MPSVRTGSAGQAGFTIVEVLVASMILLVGLMGTLTLIEGSARTVATSKGREGATNLAREVLERSRSIPYGSLNATTVASNVRAMPGMGGGTAGDWTATRRGITYTISPAVCSLDDPSDGYGQRTGGPFCPGAPAAGTADPQAEDFKRVAITVSWKSGGGTRSATVTAVRSNRSSADAPTVSAITTTSPVVSDPQAPVITDAGVSSMSFTVTASATAQSVRMELDGVDVGAATPVGNARDWTFTLDVSTAALKDGTYSLGARPVDALSNTGPAVTIPLTLTRIAPAAPSGLQGGRNEVLHDGAVVDAAELDWLPSEERNIVGYRVYRPDGSLACPTSAETVRSETWCVDVAAQAGIYGVVALYRDASNVLRESARATAEIQGPVRRFYLKSTQAASTTSANCGAGANRYRDMAEGFAGTDPGSSEPASAADDVWRFCSPALSAGTIKAGVATVHASMSNTGADCPVTVGVGTATASLGSQTQTVRAATTSVEDFEYAFLLPATSIAAGSRLVVTWQVPSGAACDAVRLRFGGTTNRSRLELPREWTVPAAPSDLSATRDANGTVTLSWAASSTPADQLFGYRIYRDGQEWEDRLGATGDGQSLTFVDANRDGGTHTYWVTAVNRTLAESDPIGPVTR